MTPQKSGTFGFRQHYKESDQNGCKCTMKLLLEDTGQNALRLGNIYLDQLEDWLGRRNCTRLTLRPSPANPENPEEWMGTFYIEWFTNNVPTQPPSQSQNCNAEWDSSILILMCPQLANPSPGGQEICAKLNKTKQPAKDWARDRWFLKIKAIFWFYFVITKSRSGYSFGEGL